MKLIIETNETDKVTKHVRVSTRGMQILLDLFAWIEMLEPFRLTTDAPAGSVGGQIDPQENVADDRPKATCPQSEYDLMWENTPWTTCPYCNAQLSS